MHAGMTCLIAAHLLMIAATAMPVVAAAVGDRVRLRSSYAAGVPLHQAPRGTHDFRRVPDGTVATMTEVAQEGRWLRLTLPDGGTRWVADGDTVGRRHAQSDQAPSPAIRHRRPRNP
jgi:hypothetical protein